MSSKRKTVLTILFAAIITLSLITMTYAWFAGIEVDATNQTASLTSGTMALNFSDNDNGFAGELSFGGTITKKFTIENTGTATAYAKISWLNMINTYLEGSLIYTLEYSLSEDGTYTPITTDQNVPRSTTATTAVLADGVAVPGGTKLYYNLNITLYVSPTVDQTPDLTASFYSQFTLGNGSKVSGDSSATLAALNITPKSGIPSFEIIATTDEGVYAMEDDYGTSYYFRGAVENNYVKFADKYWRIVRINGDGSLRIIYDGTKAHENGVADTERFIGKKAFNSSYDDNAYVGYMYGLTGVSTDVDRCLMLDTSTNTVVDNIGTYTTKEACEEAGGKWTTTAYEATHANVKSSTMKDYLETWYKDNILDKGYAGAVADISFCGDRSIGTTYGTQLGYSKEQTGYGARDRLVAKNSPAFTCVRAEDKYTVNDLENGNGELKYPVGLITADEIVGAGGKWYTDNNQYYLYRGSWYWLLSPSDFAGGGERAYVFGVDFDGCLYRDIFVNIGYGVAPVINLTAEYSQQLGGTGSPTDPYTVS